MRGYTHSIHNVLSDNRLITADYVISFFTFSSLHDFPSVIEKNVTMEGLCKSRTCIGFTLLWVVECCSLLVLVDQFPPMLDLFSLGWVGIS